MPPLLALSRQTWPGDAREAVRKLCVQFPGEYWSKLDREMAYPTEFVAALTRSGFLATLIPESGGAGLSLACACDMPFVSSGVLERLANERSVSQIVAHRSSPEMPFEPLIDLGVHRVIMNGATPEELVPVVGAYRAIRPADRFDGLDPNPGR